MIKSHLLSGLINHSHAFSCKFKLEKSNASFDSNLSVHSTISYDLDTNPHLKVLITRLMIFGDSALSSLIRFDMCLEFA